MHVGNWYLMQCCFYERDLATVFLSFSTVLAYPAYLMGVNDMLLKEKLIRYEILRLKIYSREQMFCESNDSMSHESMRQQVGSAVYHKDRGAFTVFLLISTYALV